MGQTWCTNSGQTEPSIPMDARHMDGAGVPLNMNSQTNMKTHRGLAAGVDVSVEYQIVLLFPKSDSLGTSLAQQCQGLPHNCVAVDTAEDAWKRLGQTTQQTVILADISTNQIAVVEQLVKLLSSHNLWLQTTLVAVVTNSNQLTPEVGGQLVAGGFSRILTEDQLRGAGLKLQLQLMECSELRVKQHLMYSQALQAAVDQSNDAIQIADSHSQIMYVNSSFVRLTGFTKEEAVGRSANDMMKLIDVKSENGPFSSEPLKSWSGELECVGRRKSGTALRQHLKLIPVSMAPDQSATYHVTIRRLLGSVDHKTTPTYETTPTTEFKSGSGAPSPKEPHNSFRPPLMKTQTLPSHRAHPTVDTPYAKVVNILGEAQKNDLCPSNIREALDHAMEVLRTADPYAPQSDDISSSRSGIVQGLLYQSTRRPHNAISSTGHSARTIHMSPHLRHSPATPPPQQLQAALEGIDRWDYDIIQLERVCQEARRLGPLYYLGSKIFKDLNICETLGVDEAVISSWLKLMESHYKLNPYHNSTHAADVLHAAAYLLKHLQDRLATQGEMLDATEIATICIAAVVHDLDHPGFTNPFLCNSKAQLALLYNDKSVLENHHVSLAFRLTEDSENETANIFQNLDSSTYREMRVAVIDIVLATDMSQHFEHLTKFNALMAQDSEATGPGSAVSLSKEGQEARQVLKRILVKCADISNPLRPRHLCREWADRIASEYFTQTEEEKTRNLPVVFPDFDRETCNIPHTQTKFIDFFISGLFESWDNYCSIPELLEQLTTNFEMWKSETDSPSPSEDDDH